jgi:hypothetical protein
MILYVELTLGDSICLTILRYCFVIDENII